MFIKNRIPWQQMSERQRAIHADLNSALFFNAETRPAAALRAARSAVRRLEAEAAESDAYAQFADDEEYDVVTLAEMIGDPTVDLSGVKF